MKCEKCREWLSAILSEEISNHEQDLVEAHMQTCVDCKIEFESIVGVWKLLSDKQSQEPSPELRVRFNSMLLKEIEAGSAGTEHHIESARKSKLFPNSFFRTIWPSKPTWAFSYSVALLFSGFLVGQIIPQLPLSFGQSNSPSLSQYDLNDIPEDRLIQICAVQNPQYYETL